MLFYFEKYQKCDEYCFCRQGEIDALKAFNRDGIGRKSMSEKRKQHFDSRVTSFYQQLHQSKGILLFWFILSVIFHNF